MKDAVRGYVRLIVVVVIVSLAGGGGCSTPRPVKDVRNPDPSGKIPAYKQAVRAQDRRAVRQMVKDLGSDDPAVRMFAIVALRRLTGETFGYQYFAGEDERRPAVKRWERWLAGRQPSPRQQQQQQQTDPQEAVANDGATDAPSGAPNGASGP